MKKQLILNKLFKTYALLFGAIFLATLILFAVFLSIYINSNIVDTQKQMMNNITKNIESYFVEVNDFSMDLINNKEFKEVTIEELPKMYEEKKEYSASFAKLYRICYKMFHKSYKIGVYTKSGYYTYMGGNNFFNKSNDPGIDDFVDYKDNGVMHIERYDGNVFVENLATSPVFESELEDSITLWRTMSINNIFGKGQAILQIESSGEDFDWYIKSLSSDSNLEGLNISVFGRDGKSLNKENNFDITPYMSNGKILPGEYNVKRNIVTIKEVLHKNVFVAFTIPSTVYYNRIFVFVGVTLLSGIFILLLIMYITYRTSKKLSKPLINITNQVEGMDETHNFKMVDSEIYEIDFLSVTIANLYKNLDKSIDQIVTLKSAEMHSKMLALQAQMQPHFLYNALMTISAMAEEKGNVDVSKMCNSLTQMLRYVSKENDKGVPVYEEIKHLNNYIDVMKLRFPNVKVNIDVPLDVMDELIPKLVIQPIVENSFKYSNTLELEISVVGKSCKDGFYFDISDNGYGFSDEEIKRIEEKSNNIVEYKNDLTINGMGLVNIYMRLKMLFGDRAIFTITNTEDGACVRVGVGGAKDNGAS